METASTSAQTASSDYADVREMYFAGDGDNFTYKPSELIAALIERSRALGEFHPDAPTGGALAELEYWQAEDDADEESGMDWRALWREHAAMVVEQDADAPPPLRQRDEFPRLATDDGVEVFNDAELLGVETPAYIEMLAKPLTFLTGEVWGAKDRRNTQDGDWKAASMAWQHWIVGGAGSKALPAWGASRHPEGKNKEGACIVLGSSVGGARKAKAMDEMFAMGLDIDSGARLDDVLDKIEELGLFCLVYTSWNHNKTVLQMPRDQVMQKLKLTTEPTLADVQKYLREEDKNQYEDAFVDAVEIINPKLKTKDGVVIELKTPRLEKFRLIFPLAEPVELIGLAETQQAALDIWEDKITGLARNLLGIHFDVACTDPSRLFYTARHAKDSEDWYCAIVRGDPLRFEDIKPMRKADYTASRNGNAFQVAGGGSGASEGQLPQCKTPSGRSLNEWHHHAGRRFNLADLLDTECRDKIRVAGGEGQGHVHVECPFEGEHRETGGTACDARNAIDSSSEYWTWGCHHDACQGRHKLQFLEKALQDGWFEEDLLYTDPEDPNDYLTPSEDDKEPEVLLTDAARERQAEVQKAAAQKAEAERAVFAGGYVERAREFGDDASEADIRGFLAEAYPHADKADRGRITTAIAERTPLGKLDIKAIWKELDDEARSSSEAPEGAYPDFDGFAETCAYASEKLHAANTNDPQIFHYIEHLAEVRRNDKGAVVIKFVDKAGFAYRLNKVTKFWRYRKDAPVDVSAPKDVVDHLYAGDYADYPELRGVADTPFFPASGKLVTADGYDLGSKVYLKNSVKGMARVSAKPTDDEVADAVAFIKDHVLADFPLGGRTREEILSGVDCEDKPIPEVASMFALILLPFVREMIDGPTPGHLLVKPKPGTGASLLMDTVSIIATGAVTPALAMPPDKNEMSKTLTAVLSNGQRIVLFDNINHSVDTGELASAMTTPTYQARILGKTQTVEVDVRCAWAFTGNNVNMSSELIRRLHIIPLDARHPDPKSRLPDGGWKHADIRGWATANRAKLVHACLTIIQRWVADGMQDGDAKMGSYERWSAVMSGILASAGIEGFDTEQVEWQAKTRDATAEGEQALFDVIAGLDDGAVLRMGGGEPRHDLMNILNGHEGAHGADRTPLYAHDAILMDRWGWDRDAGYYTSGRVCGKQFRNLAKSIQQGTDEAGEKWRLEFQEGWDSSAKKPTYKLIKTEMEA